MTTEKMPAVFFGHGSPMNALEHNDYTEAWQAFGKSIPRPRAIVMISAHWYINATAITAMTVPRTIHDFYGFPQELFDVQYPAPGDPNVAREVTETVDPIWVGLDNDSWGLDHGTWSVLVHAFPDAAIPVLQLSVDATKPASYHYELGKALEPLRDNGILVAGSGNIVHNLRILDWTKPTIGFDWAERFNQEAVARLRADPIAVIAMESHPDYPLAVPTPDHYFPMLYVAGIAGASGDPVRTLTDGYAMGSLSMTSLVVG